MSKVRKRDGDSSPNTGAFRNEAAYSSPNMGSVRRGEGSQSLDMAMSPLSLSDIYANPLSSFSTWRDLISSPSNPRNIRSREGYSLRNIKKVRKKEGDSSPKVGTFLKSEEGGYSSPNMSKYRSEQRYTSRSQSKVRSWDGHSSRNMEIPVSSYRHSRAIRGTLRSGEEHSSLTKVKISSREEYRHSSPMIRSEGNSSPNSEPSSRNKAPAIASGSHVHVPDRAPTLRFSLHNAGIPGCVSRFVEAATLQQLHVLGFPDIVLLTSILLTITADGIHNGILGVIFYLVVIVFFFVWSIWVLNDTRYQGTIMAHNTSKPLLNITAALTMILGFLRMILLNRSHSLSESHILSLCILLMVTISFVCIMGYEALKEPDVPKHGRDSRSFVEKPTTTDKANFNETHDVTSHQKELNGPMILSAALTALIAILISGDFKNQTASDKGKNSLHIAAISFSFLSYILGVISLLINSVPPKVHCEAHLEKVENASGVLYFVFIFLVIVTVVTITACHLSGYALFSVMPLLAELGRPDTEVNLMSSIFKPICLIIMAVLLRVMTAIIQGRCTFYRDMSKLCVSMGLVSYLSEKLATFAQPTPSKPARSQQKVEHLD